MNPEATCWGVPRVRARLTYDVVEGAASTSCVAAARSRSESADIFLCCRLCVLLAGWLQDYVLPFIERLPRSPPSKE